MIARSENYCSTIKLHPHSQTLSTVSFFCWAWPCGLCFGLSRLLPQKDQAVEVAFRTALVRAIKSDGMAEVFRQGGATVKRSAGTAFALRHPGGANS